MKIRIQLALGFIFAVRGRGRNGRMERAEASVNPVDKNSNEVALLFHRLSLPLAALN